MDCRVTLNTNESFLELLNNACQAGQKVNLLIDDNGITRMEGFIQQIKTGDDSSVIELENDRNVDLKKIIAVNGIFLPEYGEC